MLLQREIVKWGERSELLNLNVFSHAMWEQAFIGDAVNDAIYLAIAIILITIYSYLFVILLITVTTLIM